MIILLLQPSLRFMKTKYYIPRKLRKKNTRPFVQVAPILIYPDSLKSSTTMVGQSDPLKQRKGSKFRSTLKIPRKQRNDLEMLNVLREK